MGAIKANHASVEECLEDVVEQWLRDGDDPSWETLAEAVTLCRMGGGKNVALKIKQETGIGEASVLVHFASIACLASFCSVAGHAKQKSAGATAFISGTGEVIIVQLLSLVLLLPHLQMIKHTQSMCFAMLENCMLKCDVLIRMH